MATMKYIDFKDLISMLKVIADECYWHFMEDGLNIRVVDYTNVALIDLTVPTSAFEVYKESQFDFKVDIEKVKKFTDMTYGYVEIKHVDDKNNDCDMLIFTSGKYSFKLNQIEGELKKEPNVPSLKLESSTIIKGSDMRKFLKSFNDDEKIKINIKNGSTQFRINEYFLKTETGFNGNSISTYSLGYFKKLFRYVKGDVKFEMSTDMPCKINLNLNGIDIGCYMLAPRVETRY